MYAPHVLNLLIIPFRSTNPLNLSSTLFKILWHFLFLNIGFSINHYCNNFNIQNVKGFIETQMESLRLIQDRIQENKKAVMKIQELELAHVNDFTIISFPVIYFSRVLKSCLTIKIISVFKHSKDFKLEITVINNWLRNYIIDKQ